MVSHRSPGGAEPALRSSDAKITRTEAGLVDVDQAANRTGASGIEGAQSPI
jgi:hypothetical protein